MTDVIFLVRIYRNNNNPQKKKRSFYLKESRSLKQNHESMNSPNSFGKQKNPIQGIYKTEKKGKL